MKTIFTLILVALSFGAAVTAQTEAAKEFERINDEREKSLYAASQPIQRVYRTQLELLYRKATQAADLAAATKIKAEMDLVDLSLIEADQPARRALVGTKWSWPRAYGGGIAHGMLWIKFDKDSTLISGWHGGRSKWKQLKPDTVEVYPSGDPKYPHVIEFNINFTEATVDLGGKKFPIRLMPEPAQ